MIVVDASVWVSVFLVEDIHHVASRAWLANATRSTEILVVPAILPAEVSGAIARRVGQPSLGRQAVEQIMRFPTLRLVAVDQRLGRLAADLAADHQLRGADALYVAVAQRLGASLVTWDREQLARAPKSIKAHSPGDV